MAQVPCYRLGMEADRQKFTIEVPLENPNDAQPGDHFELTPEETRRMAALADQPDELRKFIEQIRRRDG